MEEPCGAHKARGYSYSGNTKEEDGSGSEKQRNFSYEYGPRYSHLAERSEQRREVLVYTMSETIAKRSKLEERTEVGVATHV